MIRLPEQQSGTWMLEVEKGPELAEPQVILRTWNHATQRSRKSTTSHRSVVCTVTP